MQQQIETNKRVEAQLLRFDREREARLPANPDPDTVALVRHYRIQYHHARLLRALSFGMMVPVPDLCAVSGCTPDTLSRETIRLSQRTGIEVRSGKTFDNVIKWFMLDDLRQCAEIQNVIRKSWGL